jgi:trans-aconitate 2-methyltransferase
VTVWDPTKYLEFADERSRPFVDLLNRVDVAEPTVVVDLGCGPGQLPSSFVDPLPRTHRRR